MEKEKQKYKHTAEAFSELEKGIYKALETYSNVHRGSGFNSMVTTKLFEHARTIVLKYLNLNNKGYVVVFCNQRRAEVLKKHLKTESYQIVSGNSIGLSIGVTAIAVKKKEISALPVFQSGGGTTRLISKDWVLWAGSPDRFEAGTPAIINIIAFARALQMIHKFGNTIFQDSIYDNLTAAEILYPDSLDEHSGKELLDELKKTLIGKNTIIPTLEGNKAFINLDNSASTPTFEPVWDAFRNSLNLTEKVQENIIQEVKSIVAIQLGAAVTDYDVIFTSNTTEAINIVSENLKLETDVNAGLVVVNTLFEHSSNDLPWRMIPNTSLIRLSVDREGFADLIELEKLLIQYNSQSESSKKQIKLVAVSGASNVLGTCNDLKEISRMVHQYGANLLVDAAQLVAHRKIDINADGIDYLAFSAHKIYAPFGCGVLVAKKGLLNFNQEEMELIHSSGNENVAGIAALGKSLVLLQRIGMDLIAEKEQILTSKLVKDITQLPGITIYGLKETENPKFKQKLGVVLFNHKSIMANNMSKSLAIQRGIGVRYGCHCAHIAVKHLLGVSPGLEKFQKIMLTVLPQMHLPGLTRISLGIENTTDDIDELINALKKIISKTNNTSASNETLPSALSKAEVQKRLNDKLKEIVWEVYFE